MTIMVKVMPWSFPFYLKFTEKAGPDPVLFRRHCETVIFFFNPSVMQLKAKTTPLLIKQCSIDLLLLLWLEY